MSIAGVGTDIVAFKRIQEIYERFGERFLHRLLGQEEQAIFYQRSARDPFRGIRFLASRFAAKEAFSKAIGLGMHFPMAWSRVQVLNDQKGKPVVLLSEPLKTWYEERFSTVHISLSDEAQMVIAFVMIESLRISKE